MIIAGKTDKGKVRVTNQDDYIAGNLPGGGAYAVVCDGMGGANGGNVASSTAVKIISKEILDTYSEALDFAGIKKLLTLAIGKANAAVYEMSRNDSSLLGMGTTVVACIITRGVISIAHAGDSRAYLVDSDIRQLTRDHSIVQEMLENGRITHDEALVHPQKNIITRALGVEESLDIDFCTTPFEPGTALLICTDGLTNLVKDEELKAAVTATAQDQSAVTLVNMANENGGNDNITVVVIYNAQTGGEIDG